MNMEFAETAAKRLVLLQRYILVAEEQYLPLQERGVQLFECFVGHRPGKVQPNDFPADCRRQVFDFEMLRHLSVSSWFS